MALEEKYLWIDYTNWKGERRIRPIYPSRLVWGSTDHHKTPQWLLEAVDVESGRGDYKMFAFNDIHASAPTKEELEKKIAKGPNPLEDVR